MDDNTGGPRGQLAADPGVAQFILDNASNELRKPEKGKPEKGIDNTRAMGPMKGIKNVNGYLKVAEKKESAAAFATALPRMTVLGVQDVAVAGVKSSAEWHIPPKDIDFLQTKYQGINPWGSVDLVYASAVPLVREYGNGDGVYTTEVANMALYAQYVASMRIALMRKSACHLYLMPLGGGVFGNRPENTKRAIAAAFYTLAEELADSEVKVHVLVWDGNQDEVNFYQS
jgi:hypothetical protein